MSKKSTKEKIEVMQAFLDGKVIEWCYRGEEGAFNTEFQLIKEDNASWDWRYKDYRIKREPLERWVNLYVGDSLSIHKSREAAIRNASPFKYIRTIKLVEVQDE